MLSVIINVCEVAQFYYQNLLFNRHNCEQLYAKKP